MQSWFGSPIRKHQSDALEGFPVAILNHNEPAFYCVPAKAYEEMLEWLEDLELNALRLMRENGLLSPHRDRLRTDEEHDRRIITDAPDIMWAIDGTQIRTVAHGNVCLFAVAEQWNAEALSWSVHKRRTHRQALDPLSMAEQQQFGHLGKDAARGIKLRHDHGSCFLADEFDRQITAWGLTPSYAFVGQPETNGVIERFFKTLKEQVVYGRIFQNIEEVRTAVRDFIAR